MYNRNLKVYYFVMLQFSNDKLSHISFINTLVMHSVWRIVLISTKQTKGINKMTTQTIAELKREIAAYNAFSKLANAEMDAETARVKAINAAEPKIKRGYTYRHCL